MFDFPRIEAKAKEGDKFSWEEEIPQTEVESEEMKYSQEKGKE